MIQDVIKKITKVKPQLSTTGGTSDARFIRKIAPCLEFGLVGKNNAQGRRSSIYFRFKTID